MKNETGGAATSNQTLGWLVRFWGLAALFYWLDHAIWFKSSIVAPYARFSTLLTSKILFLLGLQYQVNGSALTLSGRTFVIADSCTGSFVFLLLAAVIIAFPASLKEKLIGLLAGFVTVTVLNLLRTLMIVILASKFSGSFWSLHIIIGQALMIAGILVFFIWWAKGVGQSRMMPHLNQSRLFNNVALYVLGFLVSYALYTLFLTSPLGSWFKALVIRHAAVILGLFTETVQRGQVISTAKSSIRVIHGCLSSPVLVLFLGAFFILPLSWPKRLFLYLICFFPLYYVYHVIRTVSAIWFMSAGRDANFAYNFFGQVVLVKVLLLFSIYYWGGIRKVVSIGRQLIVALTAVLVSLGLAVLIGCFWQQFALPSLLRSVFVGQEFYDPGRIVSMMPVFHAVSWSFLILTTPTWNMYQRFSRGIIGIFGLNLFYVLILAALFFLGLAPHPWLIKTINIFLPFIIYFILVEP